MKRMVVRPGWRSYLAGLSLLLACGCTGSSPQPGEPRTAEQAPAATSQPAETPSESATASRPAPESATAGVKPGASGAQIAASGLPVEVPDNLGEPLVENPQDLKRLEPNSPAWIDTANKQVILLGSTCKAGYPLEFFATYPDRAYESVVVVYTRPSVVHSALLALGATPGSPVQYEPQLKLPSGDPIDINVAWKDAQGNRQQVRAQEWIRDINSGKPLDVDWVFAGSVMWEDKKTGAKSYLADRGDFITVLNLPTALLDVPIRSASALEARRFEAPVDRLPAPGTPVTLMIKPKLKRT